MKIEKAIVVHGMGGYYNDDLEAIRMGAEKDGFIYLGDPCSPGFRSIREPNDAACFVLFLDSGHAVWGDATSVCYAAAGGRRGRFDVEEQLPFLSDICESLQGWEVSGFFEMSDNLEAQDFDSRLHLPAVMYGISQALVEACALSQKMTPAEVIAKDLGVEAPDAKIPIYIQSDDRKSVVDKGILKQADTLPHGVINDVETTFGCEGELLKEYVGWIVERIEKLGEVGYNPEIHLDVYGLPGKVFEHDPDQIADYLSELHEVASPLALCIETPVIMETRQAQIDMLGKIKYAISERGSPVNLVVDEHANGLGDIREFIEAGVVDMINVKSPDLGSIANSARAIRECWSGHVRPILGGACAETDQSARMIAHVALAARPAWVMARPGLGVDEGMQIVYNEMVRTLAIIEARK